MEQKKKSRKKKLAFCMILLAVMIGSSYLYMFSSFSPLPQLRLYGEPVNPFVIALSPITREIPVNLDLPEELSFLENIQKIHLENFEIIVDINQGLIRGTITIVGDLFNKDGDILTMENVHVELTKPTGETTELLDLQGTLVVRVSNW